MEDDDRSRAELITDELECGGFTESELEDIIDACEKEKEKLE